VDGERSAFTVVDLEGAVYRPIWEARGIVAAGRARVASVLSEDLEAVPPQRRLYAGGGGSVRGYGEDLVGPLDAARDPTGGRAAVEVSAEIRARVWGDVGAVAFVDGGAVSRDVVPSLAGGPLWAAGAGLRYYSPVGPIRLDVAFPLNGRDVDDLFAAYFSIGQAF
jgi:Outer membrane protein